MDKPTVRKLESKDVNGFTFFRKPCTKKWVISGVDICRHLGYKNPYLQAKKLYSKYHDNFKENSFLLKLPTPKKVLKGVPNLGTPFSDENCQEIRCYTRSGCWFFVAKCNIAKANKLIEKIFDSFDQLLSFFESKNTLAWKDAREKGKISRRLFTDAVKCWQEKAELQGSKNFPMYFKHFTNACYGALGYKLPVAPNFRDTRSHKELTRINVLEMSLVQDLLMVAEEKTHYKEDFTTLKPVIQERGASVLAVMPFSGGKIVEELIAKGEIDDRTGN